VVSLSSSLPTPRLCRAFVVIVCAFLFVFFFFSWSGDHRDLHSFPTRRSSDLSRLSLSKHLAHNLGNLLLLGKIGVFHNRRNASSRLLLLISKHLILCIYLVFRILA